MGASGYKHLNFTFTNIVASGQVNDPAFQALVSFLLGLSHGSFSAIPVFSSKQVSLNGRGYLIATMHIPVSAALTWIAVVVVPRDDYFSAADASVNRAAIIGSVTVLVIVM